LQVQRILNKSRVPEITNYITKHPKSYILSSLTASIDGNVRFEAGAGPVGSASLGQLHIPLGTHLLLHDGLHRRAAIETALKLKPEMGGETISVVLYVDRGLRHAEQMFTDLKRHETRSARSRSIAGDHRDELARLVKALVGRVPVFTTLTEMSRSTISNRSHKLFTFSGIYHATAILLSGKQNEPFGIQLNLATAFWEAVAELIPIWKRAQQQQVSTAELRKQFVHAHAIGLAALARAGKSLLEAYPSDWRDKLQRLSSVDWSRGNTRLWEGRAMIAGRLSKARTCVILSGNAVKKHLGLLLTAEEEDVEHRAAARG
jgi:DNA sulfur modification protein DndB